MKIVVVGLGYVGLPLAVELAKHFETIGLDINAARIAELERHFDRTGEIDAECMAQSALKLTAQPADGAGADMYIVTVPTPIDDAKQPDLGPVIGATRTVAALLDPARKPVIVYESTVYPGVTEDICRPLIVEISGLTPGEDFFLGYSPERINPGDREHTVDRITKVIAGESDEITEKLAHVYGKVTSGGVFRAASIRVAEAAKVIENAQRDINIAFMNELARIFGEMGISTWDVLEAAKTKWNFLPFQPGLVGGHCIGVDPYYLSHRALELGYDPQVILSGRAVNDSMADWLAETVHRKCGGKAGDLLVLGLTFKENVPDLRNSKVADLVFALQKLGHNVTVHDGMADPAEAQHEYEIALDGDALSGRYDCVLGAVPHHEYRGWGEADLRGIMRDNAVVFDLKRMWSDDVRSALGAQYATI